jgi:uncharacterized protein (DUF488 family)
MVFTVGHSNHSLKGFMDLLTIHNIGAIGDVRSQPVSSYTPHFSREALTAALGQAGIAYVFLAIPWAGAVRTRLATKTGVCSTNVWHKSPLLSAV